MKDIKPSNPAVMPREIEGFVIPVRPTIDKLMALWIALRAIGKNLSEVRIISYSSSHPRDEFIIHRHQEGYYPIDVGPNKYQSRGTGSAVETVCRDFEITDHKLLSLVAIANRNNQTGHLKLYNPPYQGEGEVWKINGVEFPTHKLNWSAVWLIRDAYKVGIDVNAIIQHIFRLLDTWFGTSKSQSTLTLLSQVFGNPINPPQFSIPLFISQMSYLGMSKEVIEEEVNWWLSIQKTIIAARVKARRWVKKLMECKNLEYLKDCGHIFELQNIAVGDALFIQATEMEVRELFGEESPEDKLLSAIWPSWSGQRFACIINCDPQSGNYAILAGRNALDFSEVYARLQGLERKFRREEKSNQTMVWYLDVKGGGNRVRHQLLNGSPGWPLPPSKIYPKTVIRFFQESTWLMGERPSKKNK